MWYIRRINSVKKGVPYGALVGQEDRDGAPTWVSQLKEARVFSKRGDALHGKQFISCPVPLEIVELPLTKMKPQS